MTKNGDKATIRETYDLFQRLEEKIDKCVTKEDFKNLATQVEDLNSWKWKVTGFAGGVGAIVGIIISFFKDIMGKS